MTCRITTIKSASCDHLRARKQAQRKAPRRRLPAGTTRIGCVCCPCVRNCAVTSAVGLTLIRQPSAGSGRICEDKDGIGSPVRFRLNSDTVVEGCGLVRDHGSESRTSWSWTAVIRPWTDRPATFPPMSADVAPDINQRACCAVASCDIRVSQSARLSFCARDIADMRRSWVGWLVTKWRTICVMMTAHAMSFNSRIEQRVVLNRHYNVNLVVNVLFVTCRDVKLA